MFSWQELRNSVQNQTDQKVHSMFAGDGLMPCKVLVARSLMEVLVGTGSMGRHAQFDAIRNLDNMGSNASGVLLSFLLSLHLKQLLAPSGAWLAQTVAQEQNENLQYRQALTTYILGKSKEEEFVEVARRLKDRLGLSDGFYRALNRHFASIASDYIIRPIFNSRELASQAAWLDF